MSQPTNPTPPDPQEKPTIEQRAEQLVEQDPKASYVKQVGRDSEVVAPKRSAGRLTIGQRVEFALMGLVLLFFLATLALLVFGGFLSKQTYTDNLPKAAPTTTTPTSYMNGDYQIARLTIDDRLFRVE